MAITSTIVEDSQTLNIVNTFFDIDSSNTKQKYTTYKNVIQYNIYVAIDELSICLAT
ncbi:MAG: hypothetical protein ACREV6_02880 [Clostridium sp.]|uniref:hypothetical protein n=1 Tax=Clostridium sp. TaxID=1506 RepID=UPI003D6CEA2F